MSTQIERRKNGTFAKGASGNPGGRPETVREVVALAREYTETAFETLRDVMANGKNEMARVKAAELMLNRGHGSPASEIDLGHVGDDGPVEFTFNPGPAIIAGELVSEEDTPLN